MKSTHLAHGFRRTIARQAQILFTCTMLPLLAVAGLQALHPIVAHAATTFVFKGQDPSDPTHSLWTVPGNWSPRGVPGPDDDAIIGEEPCGPGFAHSVKGIPAGTVIHGLTLQCGGTPLSSLSCSNGTTCAGDLTVTNTFNWTGGQLITPLSVPAGGVVSISGAGTKNLAADNSGVGVLNVAGSTVLSDKLGFDWGGGVPPVLNNTGTFTAQPGASMEGSASSVQFQFKNQGSFVVPPGPGVVLIRQVSYDDSGSTTVGLGSDLELQGLATSTWSDGASFSGDGRTLIDNGANVRLMGNVVLGSGHSLELGADAANRQGAMSGDGTLSGSGAFVWSAGSLLGNLSVANTVATVISGPATKALGSGSPGSGVLNLAGITTLGPGALTLASSAVLNNTGTFTMRPGASINRFFCCSRFSNAGTLVNDSGGSTTTIQDGVELANTGTIHLVSGILRLNTFTEPDGGTLRVTIGGTMPGTDFGQLQVSGSAALGGNLVLTNAAGFTPTEGQTFQVITCGTCSGTFAPVSVNYRAQYHSQDVTVIPLISIALDPPDPTIVQGTTQQFTATGRYGDGSSADLSSQVMWSSADETIATIDQAGLATGTAPGTTTISATVDTLSGTTTLTVTASAVARLAA